VSVTPAHSPDIAAVRPPRRRSSTPTVLLSGAIAAEIFSGNWQYFGVPVAIDRVLFVLGMVTLVWGGMRVVTDRSLRFRPLHALLLAVALYATVSALVAHTLGNQDAQFALLDRLGLVPFVLFAVAPLVFGRRRNRNILLGALVGVGVYLGVIVLLEGTGLQQLVFPSYIRNPLLGLHFGRARGPFLESAADGLSLYICAVAAAVGLRTWHSARARITCTAVMLVCGFGVLFTLTRAVWIGAALGTLVALAMSRRTRHLVVPTIVMGVVVVVAALLLIPNLSGKASTRVQDDAAVWDRYNTNDAAIRMVRTRPLFGFGWETFPIEGRDYMRQSGSYPFTTQAGTVVHNVFLSHAAELGLIGALLWTGALLAAVGGAVFRRGPVEMAPWRQGMVAIFVAFLVVANLGPLGYAFPNVVLWTWAGVTGAEYFLRPRARTVWRATRLPEAVVQGW
jgi:putative inorganic carbon (HCO3(-)) transporter